MKIKIWKLTIESFFKTPVTNAKAKAQTAFFFTCMISVVAFITLILIDIFLVKNATLTIPVVGTGATFFITWYRLFDKDNFKNVKLSWNEED